MARAGDAKADRMKTGEQRVGEQVIKRKNAVDENVKVVEEQSMQHFDLLCVLEKVLKL